MESDYFGSQSVSGDSQYKILLLIEPLQFGDALYHGYDDEVKPV